MKLEHIISTMFQEDISFLNKMKLKEDVLVVNQTTKDDRQCFQSDTGNAIRMISTQERGLSNSRNRLLDDAQGEIAILGDDDLTYLEDYSKTITQAYETYPDADIITFLFTESEECETRRQFSRSRRLNIFNISKVASVEITFKVASVREKKIRFCPLIGLGTALASGEENAFLADALRAGLRIYHVPKTICYHPISPDRQKWKDGYHEDFFSKRGACFYRIYGPVLFVPMCCGFVLLKKRGIFKEVPTIKAISWMLRGKRLYQQAEREQICS